MTKSEYDDKAPSARDREATVGILIEHFSRDALSLDEFEQRIDASRAAHTKSALDSLTEDLRTDEAYPPHRRVLWGDTILTRLSDRDWIGH